LDIIFSAVIHCQGSTSFMMSAVAGLLPEVKTIITNAVSLHTVVPDFSQFELKVLHPMHTFPGYGHLDVFMGKNTSCETFPLMKELDCGSAGVH
jgi:hypothetical protein